eukprot:TRINITY_DN3654_c0_g1_i1.p1 TRINITY_DN3654_c0_g1~~TRINITY_DN3654_c0_g1_i1.p1  ORF type:complete len:533 (+),score=107.30 TRINITY_DN3654_c0_g1_i1:49-1647(+)
MRVFILLLCLQVSAARQVHTALGKTTDTMAVQWATDLPDGTSEVMYGTSESNLTMIETGDVRKFNVSNRTWYTRTAVMKGLDLNTKYYYKVGDKVNGYSDVFSIVNRRTSAPYNHILFGDMGSACAFTICDACKQGNIVCNATTCAANTTVGLVSEVDTADMFLHVGDFAYQLDGNDGRVGDQFFNNIEQLATRVPYMVSHGNHEDAPTRRARYIESFRSQPSNAVPPTFTTINGDTPTTNTLYFSWDHGLVHYISFSTELWHGVTDSNVNPKTFLKWFEQDLIAANKNRDAVPWILVHGHRPLYSSAKGGPDPDVVNAVEHLFFQYGVDFSINGHMHSYERSWPTYQNKSQMSYNNPTATIYMITGAAGSPEMHTPFTTEQPTWSAFRSNTFSYSRMIVHNASHIHWQQVGTDPVDFPQSEYGSVIDDLWIVQDSHGPFNKSNAPTEIPTTCDVCETHDHFAPLLNLGPSTTPLLELIKKYREDHGELAWARKLQSVLDKLNGKKGSLRWEDGLLDEKEQHALRWIDDNEE